MEKNNYIEEYWKDVLKYISVMGTDTRDNSLPLARIKRLMKVEQEVSKVSSEVPVLFSRITEIFIEELTLRAWQYTEEGKRRILQRSDVCAAIKSSDIFDFLVYLMPRGSAIEPTTNPASSKHKYH